MNPLSVFKRICHHSDDNENKKENLEDRKRDWLAGFLDGALDAEHNLYDTSGLEDTAEPPKPSLSELAETLKANKKVGMAGVGQALSAKNEPALTRVTGYLGEPSFIDRWDFLTK